MKVQRKVNGSTILEASGETLLEVFEQLSTMMEVFGVERCGLCQCSPVGFRTREVNNIKFHEAFCYNCGAALAYGQKKQPAGVLFPRRRDAQGNKLPNGGWSK